LGALFFSDAIRLPRADAASQPAPPPRTRTPAPPRPRVSDWPAAPSPPPDPRPSLHQGFQRRTASAHLHRRAASAHLHRRPVAHPRAPSPHPRAPSNGWAKPAPLRHLFTGDDHPPGMPATFSPLPSFAEPSTPNPKQFELGSGYKLLICVAWLICLCSVNTLLRRR